MDDDAEHYLRELRRGDTDETFHRLIEAGPRILPRLEAEFDRETDPATRAALIGVIWQLRVPECLPVLGKALRDAVPPVWKLALDGLVTLGGPEAIAILEDALATAEARGPEALEFHDWVAEALEQAREAPGEHGPVVLAAGLARRPPAPCLSSRLRSPVLLSAPTLRQAPRIASSFACSPSGVSRRNGSDGLRGLGRVGGWRGPRMEARIAAGGSSESFRELPEELWLEENDVCGLA